MYSIYIYIYSMYIYIYSIIQYIYIYIYIYIYTHTHTHTHIHKFMDQVETEFLKAQKHKLLVWFCYIDDVFFIWTRGQEKLSLFLEDLNNFYPNSKFFHQVNKESIHILDPNVRMSDGNISTDLYVKPTDTDLSTIHRPVQITASAAQSLVRY